MPRQPLIDELESLRLAFNDKSAKRRTRLLTGLATMTWTDAASLQRGHELALFAAAYPNDPRELASAEAALKGIASFIRKNRSAKQPPKWLDELDDSGIAHTHTTAAFSIDLSHWLTRRFPNDVELDWQDGDVGQNLCDFLPGVVARVEHDGLLDDRLTLQAWVDLATGRAKGRKGISTAAWLVRALKNRMTDGVIADRVFDSLDLRLRMRLDDPIASRTLSRFPKRPVFFQRSAALGSFDVPELLGRKLPHRRTLPPRDASALLDVCRATLAVRQRETDPITYANTGEAWLYQLERGVDVAVFGMAPDRRLPIESYFGYIAARNRVPIAYGGGWVFLDRCEVGVNLFETFRGGESSFVFTQILRVYRNLFRARRMTVDPFQFGAGNPEAIQSGAFWFYHRLGFRPSEPRIAKLAEAEHAKIRADRTHRTPAATLRRFATSPLALTFHDSPAAARPDIALGDLSLAVTEWIGKRFAGDSDAAGRWANERVSRALGVTLPKKIPRNERTAFKRLSLLIALIHDLPRWPNVDKRRLVRAMLAKGGLREIAYADALRTHDRLYHALSGIALRGHAIIAAIDRSQTGLP